MRYSVLTISFIFLFTACSNDDQGAKKPTKKAEDNLILPSKSLTPTTTTDNFQSDPVKVVEAVFEAARTKDYTVLSTLCDPMGENDEPTSNICNVANVSNERKEEFIEFFGKGKVVGKAKIEGNTASIPIKFGPNGEMDEVFVLVLRNGLWYLGQI